MRAITWKTIRDLRRQRAQVAAVGITIMLGVALFIASGGAFRNLSDSYEHTYDRLHFADVIATGGDPASVADAAKAAGADAAITRTQIDPPLLIDDTKLIGRVVGVPESSQAAVDAVDVIEGDYFAPGSASVLVETHAADAFGLKTGDSLQIFTTNGWQTVTVSGVVVSAEYIWPARSRQEVISDPKSFAVLFAPEQTVQEWFSVGPNQALATIMRNEGASRTDDAAQSAQSQLVDAMRNAGAVDVTTWQEQPSQSTLQEDLDGFSELSVAFPLLFLSAAAAAGYVLLARRVLAERPTIGALMASGARRSRLIRHYLQQGVIVGALGAIAGVVLGVLLTGVITRAYTGALGIPDTIVTVHWDLVVIGTLVGILIGGIGAIAPAITAARTAPAEAMRNQTVTRAPGWWSRFVSRLRILPVTWRMAFRDIFRNLRRTLTTMLGSVLALVLVLASIGMMTSLAQAIHVQYDEIEQQDATVVVDSGVDSAAASSLNALPGVVAVEEVISGRVAAVNGSDSYTTTLSGYLTDTQMHRFRGESGELLDLPSEGILAGKALAGELNVGVGDTIELSTSDGGQEAVKLAGLLAEPIGTWIYASQQTATSVLADQPVASYMLRFDVNADRDQMRRTITGLSGVVSYTDSQAITDTIDQYLGLAWVFIGAMVALGAVLAFAVIYVTLAVNVVERTNELATLRATGVSLRRVSGVLGTENIAATVLGIPLGLLLGVIAAREFLASFSDDLFLLQLYFPWWVLPAAALGVLMAAVLSQIPAVRAIRRMDIARVVRERAR